MKRPADSPQLALVLVPPAVKLPPVRIVPHRRENNAESQRTLDARRDHFTKKCAEVYRLLMAGQRLTVLACANAGIASLPRRILDLKQGGVAISDEWRDGVKVYFCTDADRSVNRCSFEERAAA